MDFMFVSLRRMSSSWSWASHLVGWARLAVPRAATRGSGPTARYSDLRYPGILRHPDGADAKVRGKSLGSRLFMIFRNLHPRN